MSIDVKLLSVVAHRLRELHQPGNPLILVNAWDVATSSAAVAAAWGGQDNNTGREAAFAVLRRIHH
jgi:2-methylisocitrate lyase-like PEP mutase family enzyme